MNDDLTKLVEEAIRLELNVSELYLLFYRIFPEDSEFWWKLAIEEQNHAALLKTLLLMSRSELQIPREILPTGLGDLIQSNNKIDEALIKFSSHPDRIKAFQFAFEVENSAGEMHYESFMKLGAESKLTSVFRKLNGEDINHAERIKQYMIDHQIPVVDSANA